MADSRVRCRNREFDFNGNLDTHSTNMHVSIKGKKKKKITHDMVEMHFIGYTVISVKSTFQRNTKLIEGL